MSAPKRIQLSRRKGWRKPEGAVVVARNTRWGNPYRVVPIPRTDAGLTRLAETDQYIVCDRSVAVALFEDDLLDGKLPFTVDDVRRELAGRDLACWCKASDPCHADVLLELSNVPAVTS